MANDFYNTMINATRDDGIFAATLGYDAIEVDEEKYFVFLNRKKLFIKKG